MAGISAGGGHAYYYGVSLNAAYALGPGISLEGQVAWTKADNDGSGNNLGAEAVNAYEFDIGTAVNF